MKKTILLIQVVILFLALTEAYSQPAWYWQNPLPQGNELNSVKFINTTTGWAVGYPGTILKTTNGGTNWTSQPFGPPDWENLQSVSFTDANTGTVVGERGTIRRTINGGVNWYSQYIGILNDLYDVCFTDANTGTVVGYNLTFFLSIIFRTTNGGSTWTEQTSGTTNFLAGVFFTDANTGTIVGGGGTILKTTNGGTNWTSQSSGTTNSLSSVFFTNANTGTIVGFGGTILRTTNGGTNWTTQSSGGGSCQSVSFTDANTGTTVGGNGTIRRTTNGGANWTEQTSGTTNDLYGVSFTDANTGTAVGTVGKIVRTTNGGTNWITQTSGTTISLYGVSFTDAYNGTAVGWIGIILRTTNGGTNWTTQSSGTTNPLHGVSFTDANTGTAVGTVGKIVRTTNGGANWTTQSSGTTNELRSVSFTDANIGTAVGSEKILRTTNGGINWTTQSGGGSYRSVCFTDANNGTVVGDDKILRTTNGGTNWKSQWRGAYFPLYGVSFTDIYNGTAVGWGGTIMRPTSSGAFTPLPPVLTSPPNGATSVPTNPLLDWESSAYALSYKVQVSTDSLFTSTVYDSSNIVITEFQIPNNGLIINTTYYWRVNASNSVGTSAWSSTWNFITSSAPPLTPVLLSPPNGSMVTTTPLLDWNDVSSATSYRMQVSEVANFMTTVIDEISLSESQYQVPNGVLSNNVMYYWRARARNAGGWSPWASAWNFTTHLTGINLIAGEIPVDFYLYTNYPNPFNPSTKIKFDIPDASDVKLIVYDVLGREIKTLVNEKLNAGRYDINWDGSGYPSGVYFYKMVTGDFVNVKMMVLIK